MMTVARSRTSVAATIAVLLLALFVAAPAIAAETADGADDPSMCGVMSLDELNALSSLQYDAATVGFAACTYSSAPSEGEPHSVEVNFTPISSLKELISISPGGQESTVAGTPAYFFDEKLWIQVSEDRTIAVVPFVGDGPGAGQIDVVAYASEIAEIVVPRLVERELAAVAAAEASGQVEGAAALEPSLCDAISREELDSLGPLRYGDPFIADPGTCVYQASELQDGIHTMSLYLEEGLLDLDSIKMIFPDGQELTIAGRPGYAADGQAYVDVDGALLTIAPQFFDSPAAQDLDAVAYALEVAEVVVGGLQAEQ